MADCSMLQQDPFDFAWCETHDTTFPLGALCPETLKAVQVEAISARARGDIAAERKALDAIALDEWARTASAG